MYPTILPSKKQNRTNKVPMQLDGESLKGTIEKRLSSAPLLDQWLFFICLLLPRIKKSLWWHIKIAASRAVDSPSTATQGPVEPAVQPTSHQAAEDDVGRGPPLFRKSNQENKVSQFMSNPVVTGSLRHLFEAKEQFLCSNVWICLFIYWKKWKTKFWHYYA